MRVIIIIQGILISLFIISCGSGNQPAGEENLKTKTPVTITAVTLSTLIDTVELNATSSFLLKTIVKAPVNGYLQEVNIKLGDNVTKGQTLFLIRSKEANSLGNTINKLDTSFHFNGLMSVKSPGHGFITQLAYQAGDYIQDGESLATISDMNSLVFLLDLPYELKPYLPNNKTLTLILPDGQKIAGSLSSSLPFVDPVSQTQNYVIRMKQYQPIPENLVARLSFIRKAKSNAVSLPKEAVLTNEQQTEFWIMKMINGTTAIKIPVVTGIETTGRIEILSPAFTPADKILLTGNYGLADTAQVVIENLR